MIAIRDNTDPVHLSEQELVDCTIQKVSRKAGVVGTYSNYGCNGGWMDVHWMYTKYNGLATANDYPYKATVGTCVQSRKTKAGFVNSWNNVNLALAKQKASEGPLSIAMSASENAFRFYSSGVIAASDCQGTLNHAITVIGYDDGEGAWIIQN